MAKCIATLAVTMLLALVGGCGEGEVSPAARDVKPELNGVYLPEAVVSCLMKVGRIEYLPDKPGRDYWQSPAETAERGKGDCEDQAIYLQYLLKRRGLDAEVVFGLLTIASTTGHCWCEFQLDGVTYILEPRNGSAFRRDQLPRLMYIRADGLEIVERKKADYRKRTGLDFNVGGSK